MICNQHLACVTFLLKHWMNADSQLLDGSSPVYHELKVVVEFWQLDTPVITDLQLPANLTVADLDAVETLRAVVYMLAGKDWRVPRIHAYWQAVILQALTNLKELP